MGTPLPCPMPEASSLGNPWLTIQALGLGLGLHFDTLSLLLSVGTMSEHWMGKIEIPVSSSFGAHSPMLPLAEDAPTGLSARCLGFRQCSFDHAQICPCRTYRITGLRYSCFSAMLFSSIRFRPKLGGRADRGLLRPCHSFERCLYHHLRRTHFSLRLGVPHPAHDMLDAVRLAESVELGSTLTSPDRIEFGAMVGQDLVRLPVILYDLFQQFDDNPDFDRCSL